MISQFNNNRYGQFSKSGSVRAPGQVASSVALRVITDVGTLFEQTKKAKAIKDNGPNGRGVNTLDDCRTKISQILRNSAEVNNQANEKIENSNSSSFGR